ncbi:MAG TPA: DNA translocase FtsK 4TM domain-containing protein, partial [Paludibacter sp.]|nr:DNA translocase FtsK 4TM domain-containing protein [Paludibacter sp.]
MAPKKPIKTTPKPEFKQTPRPETKKAAPTKSSNEPGSWQKFRNFITDERTRFIAGLLMLLGVLFLFLSFVSYFFTGAADQSKMDLSWHEMQQMRSEIQNWASVTGAILAETFINKWFGISSFAILYFGIVLAFRMMNIRISSLWAAFFHSCFWLIWVSVLLGFVASPFYENYIFVFSPGGKHGDNTSQWLVS